MASRLVHVVVVVETAGTAVRVPDLGYGSNVLAASVTPQAATDNDGEVFLGGRGVTNNSGTKPGGTLGPGEPWAEMELAVLRDMWVNAETSGDRVIFLGTIEVSD